MKFLNLMIDRADSETKQAKFVAKLESVGIFEHLYEAVLSGEDDLIMQLKAFQIRTDTITKTLEY